VEVIPAAGGSTSIGQTGQSLRPLHGTRLELIDPRTAEVVATETLQYSWEGNICWADFRGLDITPGAGPFHLRKDQTPYQLRVVLPLGLRDELSEILQPSGKEAPTIRMGDPPSRKQLQVVDTPYPATLLVELRPEVAAPDPYDLEVEVSSIRLGPQAQAILQPLVHPTPTDLAIGDLLTGRLFAIQPLQFSGNNASVIAVFKNLDIQPNPGPYYQRQSTGYYVRIASRIPPNSPVHQELQRILQPQGRPAPAVVKMGDPPLPYKKILVPVPQGLLLWEVALTPKVAVQNPYRLVVEVSLLDPTIPHSLKLGVLQPLDGTPLELIDTVSGQVLDTQTLQYNSTRGILAATFPALDIQPDSDSFSRRTARPYALRVVPRSGSLNSSGTGLEEILLNLGVPPSLLTPTFQDQIQAAISLEEEA
jgi:hypothetical protein